ncbi:TetR/AcrR family transcriptional regulator [Microtetraspora sp. AC03309]|uniref:TetR/AcrR family transcriptional regulator n=1 Tax=Microtetraspora sp. AC03309 TaxID=2779376 RepID=UPI001E61B7F4|nr:TetR/AcrR family transcriptional regulator [Microtetraspora sp. AC03309]MCC5575666.1 TetR/AcrR family transcriptional regulator [Microtetraspora sp. AC03309]
MSGTPRRESSDRRVRRTRRAIRQALVDLILTKGYEAVTVTDLINRADVGRSTFYAHFTDKEEVLFSSLDELSDLLRLDPASRSDRLLSFTLPMFEHLHEQRRLARALLGRRGGTAVVARGEQIMAAVVRDELLAALPEGSPPPASLDMAVICVTGAFMALLRTWADGELVATPAEMDAAFRAVVLPGLETVLAVQRGRPM